MVHIEKVMKTAVAHLLLRLFLGHLLVKQEQTNPLIKNEHVNNKSLEDLKQKYPVHKIVLNKAKFRALTTLGLMKASKPVMENTYRLDLRLTPIGLSLCRKLFTRVTNDYNYAQNDQHWWSKNRTVKFWYHTDFLGNSLDGGYYSEVDMKKSELEKYLLDQPSIRNYAHLENRKKWNKALNEIYKVVSYDDSDHFDDSGGSDIFSDSDDDLLDPLNPFSPFSI